MAPRWPQDSPKMAQYGPIRKICPGKFCVTQNLLWQILRCAKFALANFALRKICPSKFCVNSAGMAPGRPKMGPRWAQDGPNMARDGSKMAQDGPKDAPKVALDTAKVGRFQKQAFRLHETQ